MGYTPSPLSFRRVTVGQKDFSSSLQQHYSVVTAIINGNLIEELMVNGLLICIFSIRGKSEMKDLRS